MKLLWRFLSKCCFSLYETSVVLLVRVYFFPLYETSVVLLVSVLLPFERNVCGAPCQIVFFSFVRNFCGVPCQNVVSLCMKLLWCSLSKCCFPLYETSVVLLVKMLFHLYETSVVLLVKMLFPIVRNFCGAPCQNVVSLV